MYLCSYAFIYLNFFSRDIQLATVDLNKVYFYKDKRIHFRHTFQGRGTCITLVG